MDKLGSRPTISKQRKEILADVQEEILEIGFGTGLNLAYYPSRIKKITVVDNNPVMKKKARRRLQTSPIAVEFLITAGESLPMKNNSFNSVVSTFTLCSIQNVNQALNEIKRVLRPGGRFFFLEHGLSNEEAIIKWQNYLNPFQKFFGDGCNLNRDILGLIQQAGFKIDKTQKFYLEKELKTHGFMYKGVAIKR